MIKMEKKDKKNTYRKNVKFMAAAVLSAALLAGQVQPVVAQNEKSTIKLSSLIPDNITIDSPVSLSEIPLPGSEYGTLSWVDGSCVPSGRVESFEVVFRPAGSVDLSRISGWDGESDAIYSSVTVVVSSFGEESEEDYDEAEETPEESEPEYTEEPGGEADSEPAPDETEEENEVPAEEDAESETDSTDASENEPAPEVTEAPETTEVPDSTDTEENPEVTAVPEEEAPEVTPAPETTEAPADSEETGAGEAPEATAAPDNKEADDEPEKIEDIFDRPIEKPEDDKRPATVEENLTAEEQQQLAEENHSCNGIYVSGINLPWYVQFRASNGDSYEFSNESEANIFKSYEFELWDLKNNTEYSIPDGEYISVTVPVKSGYEYTIEHLLDNGSMETIIPSVDGDTMIFSTHSFSPFGIAGSKPLVGGDISDNGYQNQTTPAAQTTVTPTKKPAATTAASGNNGQQSSGQSSGSNVQQNTSQSSGGNSGSGTEDTSSQSRNNQSNSSQSVNTGDNTMIYPFVILVIAAVLIIGVVVFLKKRK